METGYAGITDPVNLREPTSTELENSEKLVHTIEQIFAYENKQSLQQRMEILKQLEECLVTWVNGTRPLTVMKESKFLIKRNIFGVKLLPFGGQLIGVVPKGGDMDLLCVVPNFVTRHDFFSDLPAMLKELDEVSNLKTVEAAHVPVIQFKYENINVDLSLAILRFEKIAEDLSFTDDSILIGMDQVSVRSISGIRDADLLLSLVPDKDNFLNTLKAVKLWAKNHGLHNSAMGYPGGIAWAIMVARVCQMYPLASVSVLVHNFFVIYSQWRWPQPVLLRNLVQEEGFTQWNPKVNTSDRHHLMPIITPAYPEHNCSFSVSKSSRDVVGKQLVAGIGICKKIIQGKEEWKLLFGTIDFFSMYKHFLMATAVTFHQEGHLNWLGFVESQIRKLVESLECQPVLQLIHLYTKPFTEGEGILQKRWFIGLKINKSETGSLDLTLPILQFVDSLKSVALERNLWQDGMRVQVIHVPRKQLGKYVTETATT